MKNNKFSIGRVFKIVGVILLVVIVFNVIPRLIARASGKDYVPILGAVYYKTWNTTSPTGHFRMTLVKNAKTNFVSAGDNCIKDSESVFCGGRLIIGADPETFMHLDFNGIPSRYAKDANNVYCANNWRIIDLDPKTLVLLSNASAKDSEKTASKCEVSTSANY